ncbi:MAG TPA: presenilin family intramembrane aspartyl protease PSH [Candidatus Thermoplasmatota archaeon]|nr:presenilin family intramembrane aspartyl protease PSH [Candidatus Thermoplasmatota archaeon]
MQPASGAAGSPDSTTPLATTPAPHPVSPAAAAGPEPDLPVTWAEYRAAAVLASAFVATILLAILFAEPFLAAGLQAFEDPNDVGNALYYIVAILAFTAIILAIAKWGKKGLIRWIILGSVGLTIWYVIHPVLLITLGWSAGAAYGLAAILGVLSVVALYFHPEWYVIDVVGLLVAAGTAAIFGISLDVRVVIALLVGLAVYDAIAVYKTKHMLSLADTVIDLRLPVLLVIPKVAGYRFRDEASKFKEAKPENKGEREAMFMGLGDLVMPTILVVSALQFSKPGWEGMPALGAAVGTLVGYAVLMGYVLKGRPQAGLPLLNGGSIVGFLTGLFAATGSIVFW